EDRNNGYTYPCCRHSKNNLQKFCQYFDRIVKDIESCYPSFKRNGPKEDVRVICFQIEEDTGSRKVGEDICKKHFPEDYDAWQTEGIKKPSEPIEDPNRRLPGEDLLSYFKRQVASMTDCPFRKMLQDKIDRLEKGEKFSLPPQVKRRDYIPSGPKEPDA